MSNDFNRSISNTTKKSAKYSVKLGFKVLAEVSKFTDYIVISNENVSPSRIAKAIEINKIFPNGIKFIEENTFLRLEGNRSKRNIVVLLSKNMK